MGGDHVLGRTYEGQQCSLARALELVGERWTLLIVREALVGVRRFEEFCTSLGVAPTVLTTRLGRLVAGGVLERVRYQERPARFEYLLTPMGRELAIPIVALMRWGDVHLASPEGPPRLAHHIDCDDDLRVALNCACRAEVSPQRVRIDPGPGAPASHVNHQPATMINMEW